MVTETQGSARWTALFRVPGFLWVLNTSLVMAEEFIWIHIFVVTDKRHENVKCSDQNHLDTNLGQKHGKTNL